MVELYVKLKEKKAYLIIPESYKTNFPAKMFLIKVVGLLYRTKFGENSNRHWKQIINNVASNRK